MIAIAFLTLIAVIWGSILIPFIPLLMLGWLFDKKDGRNRKDGWVGSIFYVTDELTNVVMGGYKKTTISAELGNLLLKGSKNGSTAAYYVDLMWYAIFKEEYHCINVMEKDDKYYFTGFRAICGSTIYLLTYYYIGLT